MNLEAIPEELKKYPNWLVWKKVPKDKGGFSKVPFSPKTKKGLHNVAECDTFENAVKVSGLTFTGIKVYDVQGNEVSTTSIATTGDYFLSAKISGGEVRGTVEISADTFPGQYRIQGDTYGRREADGQDELFIFIINKAKVLSEVTITLEAEGDPSTFNMPIKVLKPANGKPMMELIQYGTETKNQ